MRVKLSSMPDPKTLNTISYEKMRGGLNLSDDPVRVGSTQSPSMLNMWYRDGVLKKRAGQRRIAEATTSDRAFGHVWCYDKQFNGMVVYLDGTEIKYFDPEQDPIVLHTVEGTSIPEGRTHGTFFAFDECLYYKADGMYLRLRYDAGEITCEKILWEDSEGYHTGTVYEPIIAINRKADGTGGDLYQPENRINPRKQVWFDVDDESLDYYLPDVGCKIIRIQIGDDSIDTSEGTWPYSIGGRTVSVTGEDAGNESTENTFLSFSAPLHTDEGNWSASDWTESTSSGWNFVSNIVYSNFDLSVNDKTEFVGSQLLRTGYGLSQQIGDGLPFKHVNKFLYQAASMCPYGTDYDVLVLDNGVWMHFFFFKGSEEDLGKNIVSYDNATSEFALKDYFMVTYNYPTQQWSTEDYRDKEDNGWHFTKDIAYCSGNLSYEGTTIATPGANNANKNQLYNYDLITIAQERCAGSSPEAGTLLFVEEAQNQWTYVYSSSDMPAWALPKPGTNPPVLRVSNCNSAAGKSVVTLEGVVVVRIPKDNPLLGTADASSSEYYVSIIDNMIWSSCDIVWTTYNPGDVLVSASVVDAPSDYKRYAEVALYRAKRDYPNADISGKYAIAYNSDSNNINFYIDAGFSLDSYNVESTEFKASGFIVEGAVLPSDKEVSTDLTTAAVLSNKLRVTYEKENADALRAIATCEYAVSFGGSDGVCVVLGGCDAQPNAIFWSGNGSAGVDPTYFPMDQYNLCGTYQDPVTGFGKQQSSLIVFQTSHVSKASYSIDTIGERKYINLSLSTINSERGCDCPWSIALCGNNLAWMHTGYGVMYLKATTSAYENMVVTISENVNGSAERPGLMNVLSTTNVHACIGVEDGERYYAFIGSELFVWDYSIYAVSDGIDILSWSYHKGLAAVSAIAIDSGELWMFDKDGGISSLDDSAEKDFGIDFPCRYTTPMMDFGGYYKLRNIVKVVIGIRSRNGGAVHIKYGGEGQGREQQIGLYGSDMITPVVLKPRGLRLHHFQVQIESVGTDGGIELDSLLVLYTAAGATRGTTLSGKHTEQYQTRTSGGRTFQWNFGIKGGL